MAQVNLSSYVDLKAYVGAKVVSAMDKTTETLLDSLNDYIDQAIYKDGEPTEYKRTGDFKASFYWDNDDVGEVLKRVIYSHVNEFSFDLQDSGWYAHQATFYRTHPVVADQMDYILNGHMYGGEWLTHTEPYWDNFREEWTDEKIIAEFKKNLGL